MSSLIIELEGGCIQKIYGPNSIEEATIIDLDLKKVGQEHIYSFYIDCLSKIDEDMEDEISEYINKCLWED